MKRNREMSQSCKMDLDAVVKELQNIRKPISSINPVDPALKLPLMDVFAEETKFLRDFGVALSKVVPVLINNLALPPEGPLGRAALLASAKMEEAVQVPDYHNQQHIVEVVIASYILGRREKMPIYGIAELIIAAVAHDLGHTGQSNKFEYERESYSVQIVKPLLVEAGLSPASIERIEKMIFATDFVHGVPKARQAYKDALSLDPADDNRLVATQCILLTEADVLFSCFNLDYNEILSKLLSAEWKRTGPNLSVDERIKFLSMVKFLSHAASQLGLEDRRKRLLDKLVKAKEEAAKSSNEKVG